MLWHASIQRRSCSYYHGQASLDIELCRHRRNDDAARHSPVNMRILPYQTYILICLFPQKVTLKEARCGNNQSVMCSMLEHHSVFGRVSTFWNWLLQHVTAHILSKLQF